MFNWWCYEEGVEKSARQVRLFEFTIERQFRDFPFRHPSVQFLFEPWFLAPDGKPGEAERATKYDVSSSILLSFQLLRQTFVFVFFVFLAFLSVTRSN